MTAYSVTQRTAEFGIRLALGAQTGSVIHMVMRQNLADGRLPTSPRAIGLGDPS